MRAIRLSFMQMLKLIRQDFILFAAGLAPILAGVAIHYGIPVIEKMLVEWTGSARILSPYYGLFDLFFAALASIMFCFIAAMVILEEHDDHIERYLFITGLGRKGYLASRLLLPALLSFGVTVILLPIFCLTDLSVAMVVLLGFTGTLQGVIIALLIVNLSSNKLEGMAITKMSTLIIIGAFVPYFVPAPIGYLLSFLPSFWTGKAIYENNILLMLPAIVIGGIWIGILFWIFQKKSFSRV